MAPRPYTKEERLYFAEQLGIQVDPEDRWLLEEYTWNVSDRYALTWLPRRFVNRCVYLHHCIVGYPIDGSDIDHIDRNSRNNRRSNLRYLTHAKNALNSYRSDDAENIKLLATGRYEVSIGRNMLKHYVGIYNTYDEAKEARDKWLSQLEQEI